MVADWQAPEWGGAFQKFPRLSSSWGGTREPVAPGSSHLTFCAGQITFSGSVVPALELVLSLVCFLHALSTPQSHAWPSPFSLGYFLQKVRKLERKTTLFIYFQLPFGH